MYAPPKSLQKNSISTTLLENTHRACIQIVLLYTVWLVDSFVRMANLIKIVANIECFHATLSAPKLISPHLLPTQNTKTEGWKAEEFYATFLKRRPKWRTNKAQKSEMVWQSDESLPVSDGCPPTITNPQYGKRNGIGEPMHWRIFQLVKLVTRWS